MRRSVGVGIVAAAVGAAVIAQAIASAPCSEITPIRPAIDLAAPPVWPNELKCVSPSRVTLNALAVGGIVGLEMAS